MDLSLGELITQIGISGIFVLLFFQTRKDFAVSRKEFDEKVDQKDEYIRQINDKMIQLVENNTRASIELVNAVKNNTEATNRLIQTNER